MKKVALYSLLLIAGLLGSQILPSLVGPGYPAIYKWITLSTMVCLAYIMIGVGREFEIDKNNLRQYGWDYTVGMTAAAFPWIFCCLYFIFVIVPSDHWSSWFVWRESLLASRFASPTSAGILFSMLAAAGLAATWVFQKARILAIFDDLDTVLLMIPLKMAMVGFRWQLAVIVLVMIVQLWVAYQFLHRWRIRTSWKAMMVYSVVIVAGVEMIHLLSMFIDAEVPIHIEVLLPAFVLGCLMSHARDHIEGNHRVPEPGEAEASTIVSAIFMFLVGLSMPGIKAALAVSGGTQSGSETGEEFVAALSHVTPEMGWSTIIFHVLVVTCLANLGKMFPALCYRKVATWQERVALAVGMWPRGEVGAGVLIISLSYGIGGPIVIIAMLSLALNLVLTGIFILVVKKLLSMVPIGEQSAAPAH